MAGFLLSDLLHLVEIFFQLRQLRIKILDLLFCRVIQLLDLALVDVDRFRGVLFILLLEQLNLRLKFQHFLHSLIIFLSQVSDDLLLFLALLAHGVL